MVKTLNECIQRFDLLQKLLEILFCHPNWSDLVILATDGEQGAPRKSGEPDRFTHDSLESHSDHR